MEKVWNDENEMAVAIRCHSLGGAGGITWIELDRQAEGFCPASGAEDGRHGTVAYRLRHHKRDE